MDTNEYTYFSRRKSPYADSPYECAWTEPAWEAHAEAPVPVQEKRKRGVKPLVAFLLLIACCVGTALGVTALWQGKMNRMEQAMDEKFAALNQIYSENQMQNSAPLPQEGPLTPGQVYAKNVQAVVAVNAKYQNTGGYGESVGSGFFISADGYAVTNYHVVSDSKNVTVTTHKGQTVSAKVVGFDSVSDVALLKAEGENFPFAALGSSDKIAVGDQVSAIGNPLGELTASLSVGYISAKDRVVSGDTSGVHMLQTDAAINSGNSGGPLCNAYGEVVGIITAKYSGNSGSGATIEGLGFAIPVDDVKGILSDLQKFGYVTGAYLGVYVRDVEESVQAYGLPAGAYIEEPMKGFCAEKAGIRTGDIIINLGGYDVDSVSALTRTLRRFKAGETVSVTVCRNGKREYLSVTLDEKPAPTETPSTQQPTTPNSSGIEDFFGSFFPFF
ncbi:MAG: trypsin-like peptidase domain-containing protein [Oscillospiraceae bacterium]|nr:trypsin-like peptidase domain-containing protein [Oscillospiraceae bacterium]